MLEEPAVRMCLEECWGLPGARIAAHDGGMGSRTWIVDHGDRRWVAKAVAPALGDQFAGGLVVAQRVERAGILAGAPEPAVDGSLTVAVEGHRLALLPWVPGDPLTGEDRGERRLIGSTLARVHQALTGQAVEEAQLFHWVDPRADHLSLRPWLRPAVTAALVDLGPAGPDDWSWGLLHSDPAPEAFRLDPATGRCGVIDWSVALYGPLMYDLASAVMYAGGPRRAGDLIEAYLGEGVLGRARSMRAWRRCWRSGGPCRPTTSPAGSRTMT
ncbi:MAG: phosphotransferase [Actinobacteria bacterium]|nr:phosphotransferase [Actinomycetota bacterium]